MSESVKDDVVNSDDDVVSDDVSDDDVVSDDDDTLFVESDEDGDEVESDSDEDESDGDEVIVENKKHVEQQDEPDNEFSPGIKYRNIIFINEYQNVLGMRTAQLKEPGVECFVKFNDKTRPPNDNEFERRCAAWEIKERCVPMRVIRYSTIPNCLPQYIDIDENVRFHSLVVQDIQRIINQPEKLISS